MSTVIHIIRLLSDAANDKGTWRKYLRLGAIAPVCAVVTCILIAKAFLALGLYHWLQTYFYLPQAYAAFLTGGLLLVVALTGGGVIMLRNRSDKKQIPHHPAGMIATAFLAGLLGRKKP